jgi:hypothetical protein
LPPFGTQDGRYADSDFGKMAWKPYGDRVETAWRLMIAVFR